MDNYIPHQFKIVDSHGKDVVVNMQVYANKITIITDGFFSFEILAGNCLVLKPLNHKTPSE